MSTIQIRLHPLLKLPFALGVLLAIAYLGACLFLLVRQTRFIFAPSPAVQTTPRELELDYEEVWLPVSASGGKVERIHGWWIPAPAAAPAQGVLLYVHGNGYNVGSNISHAQRFHQMGFSVFLFDYRGYGRSEGGFPTELNVYQDVQRAWDYLTVERLVPPKQIFVYGHSLGGAIAIELATHHPDTGGLIVQSSFTSMRAMVDYQYPVFGIFPINLLLNQHFASITKVSKLQMPCLFIHGTEDRTVPAYMSQVLFNATPEPKQLFIVPSAGHNDVAKVSGDRYFQTIRRFIDMVRSSQRQLSKN